MGDYEVEDPLHQNTEEELSKSSGHAFQDKFCTKIYFCSSEVLFEDTEFEVIISWKPQS